jgi:hypothetical protein
MEGKQIKKKRTKQLGRLNPSSNPTAAHQLAQPTWPIPIRIVVILLSPGSISVATP